MTTTHRITAAVFCLLALGAGVSACGNQNSSTPSSSGTTSVSPTAGTTPALCADVTALRSSADKIKASQIGQGGLATLSTELAAIQTVVKQLPADASTQYSAEIDALTTAGNTLDASIQTAMKSPSTTTLAGVATDVQALGDAVRSLSTAVGSTC